MVWLSLLRLFALACQCRGQAHTVPSVLCTHSATLRTDAQEVPLVQHKQGSSHICNLRASRSCRVRQFSRDWSWEKRPASSPPVRSPGLERSRRFRFTLVDTWDSCRTLGSQDSFFLAGCFLLLHQLCANGNFSGFTICPPLRRRELRVESNLPPWDKTQRTSRI